MQNHFNGFAGSVFFSLFSFSDCFDVDNVKISQVIARLTPPTRAQIDSFCVCERPSDF